MNTDIHSTLSIISKDLKIASEDIYLDSEEDLLKWLTSVINYMLEKDFERLLQAMYRVDVGEEKFKAVFAASGNVAENLAKLVLERELEKVVIRKKYS